jgi:hypothetical protein
MAYKAQLVIRTNDPRDAETLERIRALADERGQTLSEVALDILRQGLDPGRAVSSATHTSEPTVRIAAPPSAPAATPSVTSPAPSPVPVSPGASASGARPPQLVVREFLEHYEPPSLEPGDSSPGEEARKIIIDFFAEAGPAEVHALKKALKKVLRADDFDALMEPIKQTEVYQDYKRRVLLSL